LKTQIVTKNQCWNTKNIKLRFLGSWENHDGKS
jgi:hypothetical protein